MKLAPRDIERFVHAPDPAIVAVLVHGPDEGLVRERAAALVRAVAGTLDDPFRITELSAADLRADPARLTDEAATLSFGGGRRVVRVREAGDSLATAFRALLAQMSPEGGTAALIVAEAADLGARSALRRVFEQAKNAAAIACYHDDARTLADVIDRTLRDHGLTIAPAARAELIARLGGDRQITRSEIEKIALYVGPGAKRIEVEDVRACVGDSAELTLEDVALATAGGDLGALDRALARSFQEGASPVAVMRAVARHLQRLHLVAGLMAAGAAYAQAAGRLQPRVFWKTAARFEAQARAWAPHRLAAALAYLLEVEQACKRTGAAADLLCARALFDIARTAPGHRRRAA
ncbi:MAG: DNA polymerase III subunit delta [Alphaproteobacteria bacterium]|nr:MAG: DNA polymerase III subunit delta [Alphaproteobacteria bacterium]